MGPYRIEWKRSARKELSKMSTLVAARIFAAVDALSLTPLPVGVAKLTGSENTYRIRVGDYRVIYSIYEQSLLIEVVRVGHRREVYR